MLISKSVERNPNLVLTSVPLKLLLLITNVSILPDDVFSMDFTVISPHDKLNLLQNSSLVKVTFVVLFFSGELTLFKYSLFSPKTGLASYVLPLLVEK